eukprot:PhM_4_TR1898/c1_g1_i1/m.38063/K02206/CDK2; cyclin-dependent kinase 2
MDMELHNQQHDRYFKLSKLGEGTYGSVYKCRDVQTGRIVALKKIRVDAADGDEGLPATALREISILLELEHPNVVRLFDIECTDSKLCLVFEYVDEDLKSWMNRCLAHSPLSDIKRVMYRTLLGLRYCHSNRILHRDIKPQNILVSAVGDVKLADFGLARAFACPIVSYTKEVVTQWYRPPEILLGCVVYTPAVDVWSVACIMGELLRGGTPLFPGDCEIDQLYKIFQLLGTPSSDVWKGCEGLQEYQPCFPRWDAVPLSAVFPALDEDGAALLKGMLAYDPQRRWSAEDAIESPWFNEIRE